MPAHAIAWLHFNVVQTVAAFELFDIFARQFAVNAAFIQDVRHDCGVVRARDEGFEMRFHKFQRINRTVTISTVWRRGR